VDVVAFEIVGGDQAVAAQAGTKEGCTVRGVALRAPATSAQWTRATGILSVRETEKVVTRATIASTTRAAT